MIQENQTPAMFSMVPPQSCEEATSRLLELLSNPHWKDALCFALFRDMDQLKTSLTECGFVLLKEKKPIKNAVSTTHFMNLFAKDDGAEYLLLVNEFGLVRILNCQETCPPKTPKDKIKREACPCCERELDVLRPPEPPHKDPPVAPAARSSDDWEDMT